MALLNLSIQWAKRFDDGIDLIALLFGDRRVSSRDLELLCDQELVAVTLAGKQKAFEVLLRRYQKLVYNVLFQMVQNHEAAADLTQDTFLKAFKALASFRGNAAFKPWLLKIASNTALNYIRDSKGKAASSLEEILEENPNAEPSSSMLVDEHIELQFTQAQLADAIAKLPLRQRQIFTLRYQHDLPYADIASITDQSESTIKSLLFRTREKLRKILAEKNITQSEI